jgi:hypothetical protein
MRQVSQPSKFRNAFRRQLDAMVSRYTRQDNPEKLYTYMLLRLHLHTVVGSNFFIFLFE